MPSPVLPQLVEQAEPRSLWSERNLLLATREVLSHLIGRLAAPRTTGFTSWRGSTSPRFLGTVAVMGLSACCLARSGSATPVPRTCPQPQAV